MQQQIRGERMATWQTNLEGRAAAREAVESLAERIIEADILLGWLLYVRERHRVLTLDMGKIYYCLICYCLFRVISCLSQLLTIDRISMVEPRACDAMH